MQKFSYEAAAEVYPSRRFAKSLARYRRFDRAAEAIRYVIEEMPAEWLVGTMIDVNGRRREGQAIRALYDAPDYPLERAATAA